MYPYKICCLTYKTLNELVKRVLSRYHDPEMEISIVEGVQDEIIQGLNTAERAGCEVVIGGGANAKIAREYSSIPVIEYRLTSFDYLDAIDKALLLGNKIAICSYRQPIDPAFRKYLDRQKVRYSNIIYDVEEDLHEQMLSHCGEVIIGAAHSIDMAMRLGYKHVLIYPGEEAVLFSFREAKTLAMQVRRQNEYHQFAQAVIDNSTNGLVLIDAEDVVIDYNSAAEEIWGIKASMIKGTKAESAFAEGGYLQFREKDASEQTSVCKVKGEDVLCKWVRLAGKMQNTVGVVGIFSNMSDIMLVQYEYRQKNFREYSSRGFVTKMSFLDILGTSDVLQNAKKDAKLFARSDANILLYGETGAGKEIFAQSIHSESSRKNGPFIAINCTALPESLLESELFGYDEGAFTGSRRGGKKGLFELASSGSIFLDEIGELPSVLQTRLLRVLQEHEIMHVGGDRVIPVDVRVISATNKNLEAFEAESLRSDLYYRLSELELNIPPLRERQDDAMQLFQHFLRHKGNLNLRFDEFPPEVYRIIREYPWPGNIRELGNVCERFVLFLRDDSAKQEGKYLRRSLVRAIGENRFFQSVLNKYDYAKNGITPQLVSLFQETLGFTKAQVGEKLGISRTTLWRRNH